MSSAAVRTQFDREGLERIRWRARTLDEILCGCGKLEAELATTPPETIPSAIESWLRAVAQGDSVLFQRRLSWDGWNFAAVTERFQEAPRAVPNQPWQDCLLSVLEQHYAEVADDFPNVPEVELAPLPYVHWSVPFLRWGREQLQTKHPTIDSHLAEQASNSLEAQLLAELVAVSHQSLHTEFDRLRDRNSHRIGSESEGVPDQLFRIFMAQQLGRAPELFSNFSFLGRLMATLTLQWRDRVGELIERLANDQDALRDFFDWDRPATKIVEIETSDGDRHNGGRRALVVTFDNQQKLVYKPRSLQLEAAFQAFVQDLSDAGLPNPPPTIRTLARDRHYGWVEFIEPGSVDRSAHSTAVSDYYLRAGSLVALAEALQADDLHADNVIATERGPQVIDAETLLQPTLIEARHGADHNPLARTQLVSSIQVDDAGHEYDFGGLAQVDSITGETARSYWQFANTDRMRPLVAPSVTTRRLNVCSSVANSADSRVETIEPPEKYMEALCQGYRTACRFLVEHKAEIASEGGMLGRFQGLESRVLFRPSQAYGRVIALLHKPNYHLTGRTAGFMVDALNRQWAKREERPWFWSLTSQERNSLMQLDIPFFSIPVARPETTSGTTMIEAAIGEGVESYGLEAARRAILELNESKIDNGVEQLTATLKRRAQLREQKAAAQDQSLSGLAAFGAETARLVSERAQRVQDENGSVDEWLVPEGLDQDVSLSPFLYDGVAGALLFVNSLNQIARSKARQEGNSAQEIEQTMAVRASLIENLTEFTQSLETASPDGEAPGLGACHGIGGLLYALAHAAAGPNTDTSAGGQHCAEDFVQLTALAHRLAACARIDHLDPKDPSSIAPTQLDLSQGVAGLIVGLVAVLEVSDNDSTHELLVQSLDRLQTMLQAGASVPLGLAHGASGLALAFGRAAQCRALSDSTAGNCRQLALRLLDVEDKIARTKIESSDQSWTSMVGTWCYGAPGMGLARLALLTLDDTAERRQSIERCALLTLGEAETEIDHVCCGSAGRAALLFEFHRLSSAQSHLQAAVAIARSSQERMAEKGGLLLEPDLPRGTSRPFLFRGETGISMVASRMSSPGIVPAFYCFAPPLAEEFAADHKSSDLPASIDTENPKKKQPKQASIRLQTAAPEGIELLHLDDKTRNGIADMVFPAHRHLLSLEQTPLYPSEPKSSRVRAIGVVAHADQRPVGLALGYEHVDDSGSGGLLSVFTTEKHRKRGIGRSLLEAFEEAARSRALEQVEAIYVTGREGVEITERLLLESGFEEPTKRMVIFRFGLDEILNVPWITDQRRVDQRLEIFPWSELSKDDAVELRRSHEESGWIAQDLVPWNYDGLGFEPASSLGVRFENRVVGWIINHRINNRYARITCAFIRRDLSRRGALIPIIAESTRRMREVGFTKCSFATPVHHPQMVAFIKKRCARYGGQIQESRDTVKHLG